MLHHLPRDIECWWRIARSNRSICGTGHESGTLTVVSSGSLSTQLRSSQQHRRHIIYQNHSPSLSNNGTTKRSWQGIPSRLTQGLIRDFRDSHAMRYAVYHINKAFGLCENDTSGGRQTQNKVGALGLCDDGSIVSGRWKNEG